MNNLIKIVSAIIVLSLGCVRASAEEWTYTGSYPYVYALSSDTWYYLPDSPPLVWDYSAMEWVANPLGGRAFDLRVTFDQFPLGITLLPANGTYSIRMWINYSGVETGVFKQLGWELDWSSNIYYRYIVNEKNGTCVLHGDFLDDSGYSFTLVLDFEAADSGTFSITGMFPFMPYNTEAGNNIETIEGTFTIGQLIID